MNNKERINAVTEQLKSMQAKVFQKSQGENGEYYKGLLDGTLTEFSAPKAGVTSLKDYRFNGFTNLQKLDLTGIHEIPQYLCNGCSGLKELALDGNITEIGAYAFQNCNNANLEINLVGNNTSVKDNAFYVVTNNKLKTISGVFGDIGASAFGTTNPQSILSSINIKINGTVGDKAFGSYHEMVENFYLDPNSNIKYLGNYAFSGVGTQRSTPENNIFIFDFRKSEFTSLGRYCFAGNSSAEVQKVKYFNIYFPATLTSMAGTYIFQNTDNMEMYYKKMPTLSNVNNFNNATNYKNFFPYDQVKDAKVATNWSSTTYGIVDSIYGWAEENTFTQGQTLPTTDSAGNTLTWYSDVNLTIPVTTAENPEQIYYCSWTEADSTGTGDIDTPIDEIETPDGVL